MREVDPETTKRAAAFESWMGARCQMVTLTHTFDVTRLLRQSRRSGRKFNMLLCWCAERAAAGMEEFYLLPVGEKLMRFERLAVNVVVKTARGGINTCDVPFSEDIAQFERDYLSLTAQVAGSGEAFDLGDGYMVIGTSAMPECTIDSAVNIYTGVFNNPFLIWGRRRRRFLRAELPISLQFHHVQLDGGDAARYFLSLQGEMDGLCD